MTDLPPLSDKDLEDIRFGIEHDIDMVAASFVRNAAGVDAIRAHIADCHAKHAPDPSAPPPLIISKVESTEALDRLGEIIEASDGLMVARGDLVLRRSAGGTAPEERALSSHACGREQGVEVPIAHVATWQKEMVAKCAEARPPPHPLHSLLPTLHIDLAHTLTLRQVARGRRGERRLFTPVARAHRRASRWWSRLRCSTRCSRTRGRPAPRLPT